MSDTTKALRAEIAALREELAAEKARGELLREQAAQHQCASGWQVYPYPVPGAAPMPWYQQTICWTNPAEPAKPIVFDHMPYQTTVGRRVPPTYQIALS